MEEHKWSAEDTQDNNDYL